MYAIVYLLGSLLEGNQTSVFGARPRYSLVVDEDVKKPTKPNSEGKEQPDFPILEFSVCD